MTNENLLWEHKGKVYRLVSTTENETWNACSKCAFDSDDMNDACDAASKFCTSITGGYLEPSIRLFVGREYWYCGKDFPHSKVLFVRQNAQHSVICRENGEGWTVLTRDLKELNDVDTKQGTQGVKYDSDKLQYTLIPPLALKEVARNLTIGLKKYPERNNWKKVPNAQERYLDALYRHLEAHRAGELFDPDSSVPNMYHLAAVAVNAMFLLEFMLDEELKKGESK